MKVCWVLRGMDGLLTRHLRKNVEYWQADILYNARKVLKRIDKSRTVNWAKGKSDNLWMAVEGLTGKAEVAVNDIDKMIGYEVNELLTGDVEFVLFIDDTYFSTSDMIKKTHGKFMSRMLKNVSRQDIIDGFEKEIINLYTNDFYGEIIDDDGQSLSVRK